MFSTAWYTCVEMLSRCFKHVKANNTFMGFALSVYRLRPVLCRIVNTFGAPTMCLELCGYVYLVLLCTVKGILSYIGAFVGVICNLCFKSRLVFYLFVMAVRYFCLFQILKNRLPLAVREVFFVLFGVLLFFYFFANRGSTSWLCCWFGVFALSALSHWLTAGLPFWGAFFVGVQFRLVGLFLDYAISSFPAFFNADDFFGIVRNCFTTLTGLFCCRAESPINLTIAESFDMEKVFEVCGLLRNTMPRSSQALIGYLVFRI